MPLVYTVCAKRQLIGQFPNDQQMGPSRFHQYFFVLPEIENIAQKVLGLDVDLYLSPFRAWSRAE